MNNGYINIHRKILDNPISKKPHWAWLWVYLLLRANWEEKEIIWNSKKLKLGKGSFVTGRLSLAKETGIPASTIERVLNYLESEHQIEQQKNNKYRVITIVNWDKYQMMDNKKNSQRTTSGQLADTDKNINNIKNIKKHTCDVPSQDIILVIDSFKDINQAFGRWYSNTTQREAIARLIKNQTLEKVLKVLELIPKTNTMAYLPTITTPVQLEEKWSQLEAGLRRKKDEVLSKKPIVHI